MAEDAAPPRDYRETVFLPETPFPMRAGLPRREPEILARWAAPDLYAALRRARQGEGAPLFVLHDGPPYANGPIHIGHALNKILKDFVVRSRFALGYDVDYVPGWDCHGLPIEWRIEEEYRAQGRRKDEVPAAEFRARCRAYAAEWMAAQSLEFQRLGVLGRWEAPYATMDFATEACIVAEFHKVLMSGRLYRGSKPVMWSPVERTALADAEVEYRDIVSPALWVKFPVVDGGDLQPRLREVGADAPDARPDALGANASVIIWTTTPWTIPGNRAVAYGASIAYGLYEVEVMETGLAFEPWTRPGERLILADALAEHVRKAARVAAWRRVAAIDPAALTCGHPLAALDPGYRYPVPLLAGEHVTDQTGTGFVHTAPSHGAEDYQVWLASGRRDIPDMVDENGAYHPHVSLFGGLKVIETEGAKAGGFGPANAAVDQALVAAGNLLARGRLEHSYPHSWRSRAPVIHRATPQWFIRLDAPCHPGRTPASGRGESRDPEEGDAAAGSRTSADALSGMTRRSSLRERALEAVEQTAFHPPAARDRLHGMVAERPDWLVSRQRAWGTPLALFADRETGEPLKDPRVNARIGAAIAAQGADAWFTRPAGDFLGDLDLDPERFDKVDDILDVWFDSGCTHAFALEDRADSRWPADLYLEGSDQHRGWFQSSLLEACATRGRAPYAAVVTHGFTLNERGEKMSKSLGNAVAPQEVVEQSGADVLRLWVALTDYTEDQRIGGTVLQTTTDAYRKLRNTVRYLLGALKDFDESERIGPDAMPPLERFVLHRLWELDGRVRAAYARYDFQDVIRPLADFSSNTLSALYFDVRKDSLYCDRPDSARRRAARTVMDLVFERLTVWLAPLLAFTMEEAWGARFPQAGLNALRRFPESPGAWRDDAEAERWDRVERVLSVVTAALEVERREKRIGGALEAAPRVWIADAALLAAFDGVDPAEVFRTSQATLQTGEGPPGAFRLPEQAGVAVEPLRAQGLRCARSWKVSPEVERNHRRFGAALTDRDLDAVDWWDARRGLAA